MNEDKRMVKGASTRTKILDATLDIIAKEGLNALSAKKIADAAGISKSTVFHHFEKVEDITLSLFQTLCDNLCAPLMRIQAPSLEAYLTAVGEATFYQSEAARKAYATFMAFYNASMVNPLYGDKIQVSLNTCAQLFKDRLMVYTPLDDARAEELSELLVLALDGLGMHYVMRGDDAHFMALWKAQIQLVLNTVEEVRR
ncbi:TetR/AcrR family transcriptional regulator [Fusibacter sp. JL298sf-3]